MAEKVIRSACQGCMEECSVLVHVEDGKVAKIEGNPEDPKTGGALCVKETTSKVYVAASKRSLNQELLFCLTSHTVYMV